MLCLRCDHQGSIYKIRIDEINKIVYWCDECDGTWEDPSKILLYGKGTKLDIDFYSLVEYLENHGLVYMKTPITNLSCVTIPSFFVHIVAFMAYFTKRNHIPLDPLFIFVITVMRCGFPEKLSIRKKM